MLNPIQSSFAHTEKLLNAAGYVPVLSFYSGNIRIAYGEYQVIAYAALGALHYLGASLTHDAKRLDHAKVAFLHTSHGFANITRGSIEVIPLAGFGLAIYDFSGMRFTYENEPAPFGQGGSNKAAICEKNGTGQTNDQQADRATSDQVVSGS